MTIPSKAMNDRRLWMHAKGKTDIEMAAAECVEPSGIRAWRLRYKLAANSVADRNNAERRVLYDQGMSDVQIAKKTGTSARAIGLWRCRAELPNSNFVSPTCNQSRMELYEAGMTDADAEEKLGLNPNVMFWWRKRKGLPSNNPAQRLRDALEGQVETSGGMGSQHIEGGPVGWPVEIMTQEQLGAAMLALARKENVRFTDLYFERRANQHMAKVQS